MSFCVNCGTQLNPGSLFCGKCGHRVQQQPQNYSQQQQPQNYGQQQQSQSFLGGVSSYFGNTDNAPVKMNWKKLFSAVFQRHTKEEAEDIFICGTAKTTPPLSKVSESWPTPWLYSRVFLCFLTTYFIIYLICKEYGVPSGVTGMIFIGSFAVPVTTLILFMELNVFRNISVYDVLKFFLVGGCASLLLTLFLFSLELVDTDLSTTWGAMMVGIIEEVGKLAIVYFLIKQVTSCNYILSALLAGACVGAGFAAFESAGYAFMFFMDGGIESMTEVIYQRGLLAPGGHVAWAAVTGAALVIAKGNGPLTSAVFARGAFWKIFLIPVILHGIWDAPIMLEYPLVKCTALVVLIWMVVLILINMGLDQIKKLKNTPALSQNAEQPANNMASSTF